MPVSNRSGPAGRALIFSSLERARRRPPDLQAFADPAGPEVQPLPPGARRLRAARPRNYCVTEEPCAAAGLSRSQARDWCACGFRDGPNANPWRSRPCSSDACERPQWSQALRSTAASGSRESKIRTGEAAVPIAAATKEKCVPWCPATYPQNALPPAHAPIYTSMKTADARARTQSDARFCISVLISDITAVHAAPPNAMATHNRTIGLNVAVKHSSCTQK